MNSLFQKHVRGVARRLLLLFALLLATSATAFTQPATKPQASPTPASGADVHARVTETLIDSSIADDPAVDQMLVTYAPKVREIEKVIGKLKGDLRKGGVGAGSLGNFVTAGILFEARQKLGKSVALAVRSEEHTSELQSHSFISY